MEESKGSRVQGFKGSRFQRFKALKLQESRVQGLGIHGGPGSKGSWLQGVRGSTGPKDAGSKGPRVQGLRVQTVRNVQSIQTPKWSKRIPKGPEESKNRREHFDFTPISHEILFEFTPMLICVHFDFTPFLFDFTSIR